MLSKDVSSTIFKVFGMTRPGIEPQSPGPLVNTLPILWTSIYQNIEKLLTHPCNIYNFSFVIYSFLFLFFIFFVQYLFLYFLLPSPRGGLKVWFCCSHHGRPYLEKRRPHPWYVSEDWKAERLHDSRGTLFWWVNYVFNPTYFPKKNATSKKKKHFLLSLQFIW